jgi:hypothetical protein
MRNGTSLVAIFILTFGIVALFALITLGIRHTAQAKQLDMCAACGQAAIQDIKIGYVLCHRYWSDPTVYDSEDPFVIDPIAFENGLIDPLGGIGGPQRITVTCSWATFKWKDDLIFSIPQDSGRPKAVVDEVGTTQHRGDYSWFTMVEQQGYHTDRFKVAAVVCYKRQIGEEQKCDTVFTPTIVGTGVVYTSVPAQVKKHQYVLLYYRQEVESNEYLIWWNWYEVMFVGNDPSCLTLRGADWPWWANKPSLIVVDGVIGVYNTQVEFEPVVRTRNE